MHSGYKTLATTVAIHFFIMFALMYAMVFIAEDIFININQAYMAALMVLPMVTLMLVTMPSMFRNTRLNYVLHILSLALFLVFFAFIRTGAFVHDKQFLRSMIPHHSSALVMCQRSTLTDPEIKELCANIVKNQTDEIFQMKRILKRLSQSK